MQAATPNAVGRRCTQQTLRCRRAQAIVAREAIRADDRQMWPRANARAKCIDAALRQLRIVKAQRVNGQLRIVGFNARGGVAGIDGQCGGQETTENAFTFSHPQHSLSSSFFSNWRNKMGKRQRRFHIAIHHQQQHHHLTSSSSSLAHSLTNRTTNLDLLRHSVDCADVAARGNADVAHARTLNAIAFTNDIVQHRRRAAAQIEAAVRAVVRRTRRRRRTHRQAP
jgi:hypothetical protein